MRKLALALVFFLITSSAHAEFGRSTTFDDREECKKTKGVWREFGNSSADSCESKLDRYSVAAQVITYSCDCGKGRCWNGETCVAMQDYKKIYDRKKAQEDQKIAAARKARSEQYRDYLNENLSQIISQKVVSSESEGGVDNNLAQFRDDLSSDFSNPIAKANNAFNSISQQVQNIANQNNPDLQPNTANNSPLDKILTVPTQNNNPLLPPANNVVPDNNSAVAGPTPFFLQQQENAKKEAEVTAATTTPAQTQNKTATPAIIPIPPLPKEEGLPELPQIPLPQ